jgi:hypothetical protein
MRWLRVIGTDLLSPVRAVADPGLYLAVVVAVAVVAALAVAGTPFYAAYRFLGWTTQDSMEGAMWSVIGCLVLWVYVLSVRDRARSR